MNQNSQNIVLISNSGNAWPTEIVILFMSSLHNFTIRCMYYFSKRVDDFWDENKICCLLWSEAFLINFVMSLHWFLYCTWCTVLCLDVTEKKNKYFPSPISSCVHCYFLSFNSTSNSTSHARVLMPNLLRFIEKCELRRFQHVWNKPRW